MAVCKYRLQWPASDRLNLRTAVMSNDATTAVRLPFSWDDKNACLDSTSAQLDK